MTDSTITIEVDGQKLEAKPGQMLIEVTDAAGISVPRFCYHDKLSIAANCRMCLVDVENVPKPLPACATPCNDGMIVHTKSPRALAAQKGTMEFLLINHPLDCPICDQGGECELQDVAMGYGADVSRFSEGKRVVPDPDLGALIATDMTRCIHCTRCVRFGAEIAGVREMGATGRGEHMKIGTYVLRTVDSELSGNVIDLCPVGALTSKPARFQARAWELTQHDGIAPHDCVGSNIHLHVRRDKVMRVVPKLNEAVNECWISDRDRFSYEGIYAEDRLLRPMLKEDGKWREVGWEEALELAATTLKSAGSKLATLASPNATIEEMFLAQKLTRGLGSHNLDSRLRQTDFRNAAADPVLPWLGQPIAELESNDATLLVGSNIRKDQPLLGLRVRKSAHQGAAIMAINPIDYDFNFELAINQVVAPSAMLNELAAVAKAAGCQGSLSGIINAASISEQHKQIAEQLKNAKQGAILLGNYASSHPDFSLLRGLAASIAEKTGATYGVIPASANATGAWAAGMLPHRLPGGQPDSNAGLNVADMLEDQPAAFLLLDVEPSMDLADPLRAARVMSVAKVVALTSFQSDSVRAVADIMLPIGSFAETSGSYMNAQGDVQSFNGAMSPLGEARPAWKVLRVLGNLCDQQGFDYVTSQDVLDEFRSACDISPDNKLQADTSGEAQLGAAAIERVADVPLYASDAIVRRSGALQHSGDAWKSAIRISAATAGSAGLADGELASLKCSEGNSVTAPVVIDERVTDGTVWYPAAVPGAENLARLFGEVTLTKG
ncbi:MAG: NADH-quinone oxidoreductase subunit NuoG [Chromatiales bacterium]|jgi:NADH-quinone oxidoreductase subunit G